MKTTRREFLSTVMLLNEVIFEFVCIFQHFCEMVYSKQQVLKQLWQPSRRVLKSNNSEMLQ